MTSAWAGHARCLPYFLGVLIAFNKPYGVLSQFTVETPGQRTLAEFGFPKGVYPIGRLDADSEGLLLLSDEPDLNQRLLHPRHAHEREYWAQVERIPTPQSLEKLTRGMVIQDGRTLPCRAWILVPQPGVGFAVPGEPSVIHADNSSALETGRSTAAPTLPPRNPPIRVRKTVPDCWIGLELIEGKNRQVRRMTAAIGHPTLRLVRVRIGALRLGGFRPGEWKKLNQAQRQAVLS